MSEERINRFVGKRILERRKLLRLSQVALAEAVGIYPQQLHKHEQGRNRLAAGLLYDLARALDLSPNYFFEGLEQEVRVPAHLQLLLVFAHSLGEIRSKEHLVVINQLVRGLGAKPRRRNRRSLP